MGSGNRFISSSLKSKSLRLLSFLTGRQSSILVEMATHEERVNAIATFFDANYWLRRYPRFASKDLPLLVYLRQKACCKFDPHPLFDGEYYYSQLGKTPEVRQTLVEHYVSAGAAAGLDTSPLFSTSHYLDSYPDVKLAGVNPLLHFISWGINEGRLPLPGDVRDLESRVELVLNKDELNPFGLAYRALCMARKGQHQRSADTLESAKSQLPPAFYLKIEILCLVLAGRTEDAENAYARYICLPGVLPDENGFSDALIWGGRVAEENDEIETAIQLYWLAFEKSSVRQDLMLYHLASLQIKVGNLEKCALLLSKISDDKDATNPLLVNILSVKAHCQAQGIRYTELYPERPIR